MVITSSTIYQNALDKLNAIILEKVATDDMTDEIEALLQISQGIQDGYQWAESDLDYFPDIVRAEVATQVQVEIDVLNSWRTSFYFESEDSRITMVDMNDYIETGLFPFSSSPLNFPSTDYSYCILEVLKNYDVTIQRIVSRFSGSIATRRYQASEDLWYPWIINTI